MLKSHVVTAKERLGAVVGHIDITLCDGMALKMGTKNKDEVTCPDCLKKPKDKGGK